MLRTNDLRRVLHFLHAIDATFLTIYLVIPFSANDCVRRYNSDIFRGKISFMPPRLLFICVEVEKAVIMSRSIGLIERGTLTASHGCGNIPEPQPL